MNLFDVYPLLNLTPVKGTGVFLEDDKGDTYLDLYGGHAVISIGHSHPHYVEMMKHQLENLAFYSNSVLNPLQSELAWKLGQLSGYENYRLFLCNSGAEANENALKLASFATGRAGIIAFKNGFHGRTSAAVAATDNDKIKAPINNLHEVALISLNDLESLEKALSSKNYCAVIVEGIQGIGGIVTPEPGFLEAAKKLCERYGSVLILDEIQSGYGRSGKFFAHQYTNVQPDIITVAKGMGNGFPIGGVLINPNLKPSYGMLGTTFGGSHLACAAGIAVLDVLKSEDLIAHAAELGQWWISELSQIQDIKEVRGCGLMIALDFDFPIKALRTQLIFEEKIMVGTAKNPNTIRLLPPLNVAKKDLEKFNQALVRLLGKIKNETIV